MAYTETFFVSPVGDGSAPKDGSAEHAFSIAQASTVTNWAGVDAVNGKIGPNDLLVFLPGIYTSKFTVRRSGLPSKPIDIKGYGLATIDVGLGVAGFSPVGGGVYSLSVPTLVDAKACWADNTPLYKALSAALSPGQFFPDAANKILYIRLPDDADPTGVDVVVGQLSSCLEAFSQSYVNISGITLTHSDQDSKWAMRLSECSNFLLDSIITKYNCYGGITSKAQNTTISNCDISYSWNGRKYGDGGGGVGLYIEAWGTGGNRVIKNKIHDNYVGLNSFDRNAVDIIQNVIYANHVNCIEVKSSSATPANIIQNTIHHKPTSVSPSGNGHGIILRDNGNSNKGAIIKGNVMLLDAFSPDSDLLQIDRDDFNIDIDYNVYFRTGAVGNLLYMSSTNYTDIASWRTACIEAGFSGCDQHSIISDPLFVDAVTGDYHLQIASPCVKAGIYAGFNTDIEGFRLFGSYDVGSYGCPARRMSILQQNALKRYVYSKSGQLLGVPQFSSLADASDYFSGRTDLFSIDFTETAFNEAAIDAILVSINNAGTAGGTFNQSGGSAPSAAGEAAITAMRSRGWTVTVTGGF